MTPTTITRADELATASEELLNAIDRLQDADDAIAIDECATDYQQDEVIEAHDWRNYFTNRANEALAAYRAARSTDGPAAVPIITGEMLTYLMEECGLIDSNAIYDAEDYDKGVTLYRVDKLADKINAAREDACDDTARLDWLEQTRAGLNSVNGGHVWVDAACGDVAHFHGNGYRGAIDAARAASGTGEKGA